VFSLRRPDASLIEATIRAQESRPFTYDAVGWTTRPAAPAGFRAVDHASVVGRGADDFRRARRAMQEWRMLRLGWIERVGPAAPIVPGGLVGILARQAPLWVLSVGRIIAVEDAPRTYAFSYGTLPEYPIRGEERFAVVHDPVTDLVRFEIYSFSRPSALLMWLGQPMVRLVQKRFCREASASMRRAVAAPESAPADTDSRLRSAG